MQLNRWTALGFVRGSEGQIVVLECRITGMQVRISYSLYASGIYDN